MAALGWLLNLDFAAGDGAVTIPATLGDLTTLWMQEFQPALHDALAVGAAHDDTTLVDYRIELNIVGYDGEDDLNTALAKYIDTEM